MSTTPNAVLPAKLVLFPDTNIFVEAKDVKELPWEELASQEVKLMACPTVLEEIDDLKTSPKNRVKERARKWNSNFKKLLIPDALPLVLKESSPRVTLELLKASTVGPSQGPLDLTKKDNQVVDWTLRYRDANQSEDVRLLTEDTGPLGKAYELSLAVIPMPEHWRPDLGPSDEQKEIARLRQDNERLRSEYTSIAVRLEDQNGLVSNDIEIRVLRYPELTPGQIGDLLGFAHEQLTVVLESEASRTPYRMLSQLPTRHYVEKNRREWSQDLAAFLERVHTVKNDQRESQILRLIISCDGVRPAENIRVSIEVTGALLLAGAEPTFQDRNIQIPDRPSIFQQFQRRQHLTASPVYPPPSDPRGRRPDNFYRETSVPWMCGKLEYGCPELTHQADAATVQFRILPTRSSKEGPNGHLQLTIRARNLPEPVSLGLGVSFELVDEDTLAFARELIDAQVRDT